MQRWWSTEKIPGLLDHLRGRLLDEAGSHGPDVEVVNAVLTLALKGEIEIGERDGVIVLRRNPPQSRSHGNPDLTPSNS